MSLPPLRMVDPTADAAGAERVRVAEGIDVNVAAARAFGAVLLVARAQQDLPAEQVEVFVSAADPAALPPHAEMGRMWAPHLVAWAPERRPGLAWERSTPEALEAALDAPAEDIALWAAQPAALLRLGAAAPAGDSGQGYLSLRWLLANPQQAASAASAQVAFEHVSVHASPEEMARVRLVLREALGLVELPRPRSILVPGHWLAAGPVRVHLNARAGASPQAVGTAPNHICFAVADLDAAHAAVETHGFACQRAGSLDGQVWFRLDSGTVIELQPRRR